MECINLKQHFETIKILNMLNEKISIEKIKNMYIENDVDKLLNSIDEILSDNIYFFALTEDNIKDLYILFEYIRFDYEKRNNDLIFKCNNLIEKLNQKIYELNNITNNVEQRKIDKNEIIDTCFSEDLNNCHFSVVSFTIIKKIWKSEYYIIKYLIDEPIDEICRSYLDASAFVEFGIIHLLANYFNIFNVQEKTLLFNLLNKRKNLYNAIHEYDIYNIYSDENNLQAVIAYIINYMNNYHEEFILKKDK